MMSMTTKSPLLTDQLREAIRSSGESSSDICRATKVDPATISRFMRGERGLSMEALNAIVRHLRLVLVRERRPAKPGNGKSK